MVFGKRNGCSACIIVTQKCGVGKLVAELSKLLPVLDLAQSESRAIALKLVLKEDSNKVSVIRLAVVIKLI